MARRAALAVAVLAVSAAAAPIAQGGDDRRQSTTLMSERRGGGIPNGESVNPVLSMDRRWTRLIAFESTASDLVRGDGNGNVRDVFMIRRGGRFGQRGTVWQPGPIELVSRPTRGSANGPSFAAAVDGSFDTAPRCVAFLSDASNLVSGDTNRQTDAFVYSLRTRRVTRVSRPGGRQSAGDTTEVAVSGDCSHFAYVTGGVLYVGSASSGRAVDVPRPHSGPSFAVGKDTDDLVFAGARGVYVLRGARGRPGLLAAGGRNPAYYNFKRHVIAFELDRGGTTQVMWQELGRPAKVISSFRGELGNGPSRNPVIGDLGYYVTFESDASNLSTDASFNREDDNGRTDVYLYTDRRRVTIAQSISDDNRILRGGGAHPAMSFYTNYILYDTPAALSSGTGPRQVYMRYLGPL